MIRTKREAEEMLVEMVELVRHTYSETMSDGDARGLARLEQSLHRQAVPRQTRGLRLMVAAIATVIFGVGATLLYRQLGAVTYEVMNGTVDGSGFVRPTALGAAVVFSEGSELTLHESARTRVQDLTADGGRVVVESGSIHARIVPRKRARWFVDAGPYTIRVTGTAFDVKWSWAEQRLDIRMERGSVIVTGPLAPAGVTLTAGMRLMVNPRAGLQIGGAAARPASPVAGTGTADLPIEAPAEAPRGPAPGDLPPGDVTVSPTAGLGDGSLFEKRSKIDDKRGVKIARRNAAPGIGRGGAQAAGYEGGVATPVQQRRIAAASPVRAQAGGATREGEGAGEGAGASQGKGNDKGMKASAGIWERQLARGNVQGILDDAEAKGIDSVLMNASGRELSALADAARYRHRSSLAQRALLSVRDRFPRSPESREAAFFLGALAEDAVGAGGSSEALAWYERYLQETGVGRYSAQALGRKMVMIQKLKGNEAARPLANEYLERFPGGPYAPAARKLIRTP